MPLPSCFALLFSALSASALAADTPPAADTRTEAASLDAAVHLGAPDAPLPVDPDVRQGVLPNGLRWYAEQKANPAGRAELRLVVRAGSVLEDEDQRGAAHFLEHMAFNGTERYPGDALVRWAASVGMAFGPHVNARTGFDETVYELTVPTASPEVLDEGLRIMRDQVAGILLDPVEIEKERGVVVEEWRQRRGASGRVNDVLLPSIWKGSPYAVRLPIGDEAAIGTLSRDALARFYRDWYRPDLMAVVVVGDVDPARAAALVETHFASLQNPAEPRPHVIPEVPKLVEPEIVLVADPEIPKARVSVISRYPSRESATYGGFRDFLLRRLALVIMNERLDDRASSSTRWSRASADWERLSPEQTAFWIEAEMRPDKLIPTVEGLFEEIGRAHGHGFTEAELVRARRVVRSDYETWYARAETERNSNAAAEIIRVFTTGESMAGTEWEYQIAVAMLEKLTVADVTAFARTTFMKGSTVVAVSLPKREGTTVPTEADVRIAMNRGLAKDRGPLVEEGPETPLMRRAPAPGKIVVREEIAALGVTKWTLGNGVEVWVKPTDFLADEVLFGAWSPGGSSLATGSSYFSAEVAAMLGSADGLGKLDARALRRFLTGREAWIDLEIDYTGERVEGTAAPRDLETLLQLAYLSFTAPRFEGRTLESYKKRRTIELTDRLGSPDARFVDAQWALLWDGHMRHRTWTPADIATIELRDVENFYEARFSNAADFRWVIVGDVDLATLEPLVARYLGRMPTRRTRDVPTDDGSRRSKGVKTQEVRAGVEPVAKVDVRFHGAFVNDWLARDRLDALTDVMQTRLREELREERGGTYGVNVGFSTTTEPEDTFEVSVRFTCAPDRVGELKEQMWRVLAELRDQPVDARYVDDERELRRSQLQTSLRTNSYWRSALTGAFARGEDPLDILGAEARNASLDAAALQEAARKYLDPAQYVEVVLLPK